MPLLNEFVPCVLQCRTVGKIVFRGLAVRHIVYFLGTGPPPSLGLGLGFVGFVGILGACFAMVFSFGVVYHHRMDYIDWLILKAIVLIIAVFLWNFWREYSSPPPSQDRIADRNGQDRPSAGC